MPKPLTHVSIANLKARSERYEVSDPGCSGLRVVVFPSGKRSFILRYRYRGLQRKLTLGPSMTARDVAEPDAPPEIGTPLSLAAARQLATTKLREAKGGKTTRQRRSRAASARGGCRERHAAGDQRPIPEARRSGFAHRGPTPIRSRTDLRRVGPVAGRRDQAQHVHERARLHRRQQRSGARSSLPERVEDSAELVQPSAATT